MVSGKLVFMNNSKSSDIAMRWEKYRYANSNQPSVRENELKQVFELIHAESGENIWEVGTGNGYLTFPLVEAVGETGEIVTTDVNEGNIEEVRKKSKAAGIKNIQSVFLPVEKPLLGAEYENAFDGVVSIATLHHFDDRSKKTGETGRIAALTSFFKTLRSGGRLVVADVAHGTISQKYFDAVDNPMYCFPLGHPHDFFSTDRLSEICKKIGFIDVSVIIKRVPWRFTGIEEAKNFIHTIHNSHCSPEESFELAQKYLGLNNRDGMYELGWELFFLKAKKP